MRRTLSVALALLMILSASFTAFAAEKTYTVEDLSKKYNLKDVDRVPENVKLIEFKNEAELAEFLEEMSSKDATETEIVTEDGMKALNSTRSTSTRTYKKTKSYTTWKHVLSAKISIYSSGSFGQINGVQSITTYGEGVNMGVDYVADPYASGYSIASDKQSVDIWGAGDIEYYLLIEGVIKLYTDYVEIEGTFSL